MDKFIDPATEVSRRDVIKRALRVGGAVYVAPVVLMALSPASALAAVTGLPTPVAPTPGPGQPCNVGTTSGGQGKTTTVHELGRASGTFNFGWEAYGIPDQFDVYYQGAIIFTTGGPVSGSGSRLITYSGTSTQVTVVVTGTSSGTVWDYTVGCPAAQ